MATNYVLIDFENVQPSNLEVLKQHTFKVVVFVGANQAKVPFELAAAMQALGDSAQYIKIAGTGKNALDFHIAYYIGELVAKDSSAYFHIISRDSGFDTLIKHLKTRGIKVQRESDLAEIPIVRMSTATSTEDMVSAIVKNLIGRGQSRPRKVKTLSNTINSLFTEKLSEQQLTSIVKDLECRKYIKVSNGNVSYQLPQQS
ncbi:PIN domain-containing protein [Ectothiorhodospira marina]|uniref:NYN domain-containing protein n=1 Tax=Ectothiorhodospira marina TaxID=1396821 RepID=A0A1H7N9E1_9GAMM|nr:PIN domain-containing protein [Ectothiorhodospira marina]SEL19598.1 NYN domain-containing protein [Ectothiorhodospira marina]